MEFIKIDKMKRILELGLQTQKNVLLWGPPGHGKSEFVYHFFSSIIQEEKQQKKEGNIKRYGSLFVQSFGEGMSEDRLYGGVNFHRLEKEGVLEYNVTRSFLSYDYVIFEELFDAPPVVLLSLKDTLQNKELRNGAQRFKMRCKSIVALTNVSPNEIEEMGPTYKALLERFPLQLEVKWESYLSSDYAELFEAVRPDIEPGFLPDFLEEIGKESTPVSPRQAIHALEIWGYTKDIKALEFIPELAPRIHEAIEKQKYYKRKKEEGEILKKLWERYEKLPPHDLVYNIKDLIKEIKNCQRLIKDVEKSTVLDCHIQSWKDLREKLYNLLSLYQSRILDLDLEEEG